MRVLPGGGRNLGSPRLPRSTWEHRYRLGVFHATASISMFMVHLASFHPNPNHDKAAHFLSVILKPFCSCNCILRQQLLPSCLLSSLLRLRPFQIGPLQWEKNHYFLLVFISVTSFLYCVFSFCHCKEKSRIAWTQFSLLWTKSHRLSFTVVAWNIHLKMTGTWRKSSYPEARRSTNYIWILHHKTLGQLCHWLNPNNFNWKAKPRRFWTHQWDWKSWSDEQT